MRSQTAWARLRARRARPDGEASEFACKEKPGNTWYQFRVHGEIIGHSGPAGLTLALRFTDADDGRTLVEIVDQDGEPVTDEAGRRNVLSIDRPAP